MLACHSPQWASSFTHRGLVLVQVELEGRACGLSAHDRRHDHFAWFPLVCALAAGNVAFGPAFFFKVFFWAEWET
jgi:hypothetical protein